MNRAIAEKYRTICQFQFDEPDAARPFSARLAHEQRWSEPFAARAIEEYRRFVLLAMTSERPVCPSDEVDEVWHLHLLYTRSYWQRFCGETLGRPLHHEPSRGGVGELAKHRAMYAATLDAYRETFGEEPPADLWPSIDRRFAGARRGVDRWWSSWHSLVARFRRRRAAVIGAAALLPLLGIGPVVGFAPSIGIGPVAAIGNPFDLRGPDFLTLYLCLIGCALVVATVVRYVARRQPVDSFRSPRELDPYEVAYLAGGPRRAINTAVTSLVQAGQLTVASLTPLRLSRAEDVAAGTSPLEEAVFWKFRPDRDGDAGTKAHRGGRQSCAALRDSLREDGLVVSHSRNLVGIGVPLVVMLAVLLFGAAKVAIGLDRGRPIGFLVVLCIGNAVVTLAGFARRLLRTPEGDRTLAQLEREHLKLRDEVTAKVDVASRESFALAVGLYGLGILSATPLSAFATAMGPQVTGSGGCGSGCGGGGCGGGGCGGGCGGCG